GVRVGRPGVVVRVGVIAADALLPTLRDTAGVGCEVLRIVWRRRACRPGRRWVLGPESTAASVASGCDPRRDPGGGRVGADGDRLTPRQPLIDSGKPAS